ncbi:MAG: signal recognition particle-docking protein FtsY [Buchnera aphidicola (Periphyllus lyropictus)]|uniref:signal recognition particle-docking protein FtsY n=1 Tax=Buchnera aphidicola TaxID=9 RepID=UPI001EBD560D|nr:signal recognition particle-docking protein FtsY [Buchnera aphidicola]NIH16783.1 signal recognition particle-docking protein FtsY [Buchnera aphidicola (Periphyllus lyropictus)]USS94679.1 signal recognition particle-docking protein FtsY [Buchnera aphidicola (Periphyllus lyropictus)]
MSKNKKSFFFSFLDKINIFKKKKKISKKKIKEFKNNDICSKNLSKLNKKKLNLKKKNIFKNKFFYFFKKKFKETKDSLKNIFNNFFTSKKLNKKFLEKIKSKLLSCDINVKTTEKILENSIRNLNKEELKNSKLVYNSIINEMNKILNKVNKPVFSNKSPKIIVLVGVNGSGKTTTVFKLANLYKKKNKKVLVAAADTFRAAAIDQIKTLCIQNNISITYKKCNSDPASVVYDAVNKAISKKFDVLIVDTAGRLHTKINLMNELKKIITVIKKINKVGPSEIILTIDSCTGQNALVQTELFNKFLGITGLILTKFDGTAKGGIIFSITDQFSIPIRYITIGESIDDIYLFNKKDFVDSIFNN